MTEDPAIVPGTINSYDKVPEVIPDSIRSYDRGSRNRTRQYTVL